MLCLYDDDVAAIIIKWWSLFRKWRWNEEAIDDANNGSDSGTDADAAPAASEDDYNHADFKVDDDGDKVVEGKDEGTWDLYQKGVQLRPIFIKWLSQQSLNSEMSSILKSSWLLGFEHQSLVDTKLQCNKAMRTSGLRKCYI